MATEYAGRQVIGVNGTVNLHAVAGHGHSEISVRETSCYCETCLIVEFTCHSWKREYVSNVIAVDGRQSEALPLRDEIPEEMTTNTSPEPETISYEINDFVAAKYNDQWYIGKIVDRSTNAQISVIIRNRI